jgi:hypothetical protein
MSQKSKSEKSKSVKFHKRLNSETPHNEGWSKDEVSENTQTVGERSNAKIERSDEVDEGTFDKFGDFRDGTGAKTWVNTYENKYSNRDPHIRSDPFFYGSPHSDTEKEILQEFGVKTHDSNNESGKYYGEEFDTTSNSPRNFSDSNDENSTISGGKKTRRKKYRRVRQIKRKTKRHRKTKYNKKKYSKRR